MRELEPLSETAEVERMFADDVTAAEGHHPDLAIRPCADLAVAPRHAIVARAEALCLGHNLKKLKRGPAWAIDLHPMMHLDDLGVERRPHQFGGELREIEKRG